MRLNKIIRHPVYQEQLQLLEQLEKNRKYCKHNQEHFLDVARLTYIFALEKGFLISDQIPSKHMETEPAYTKDMIYAAAFLHDIGKGKQYVEGTPHEAASAEMAIGILQDCGYNEEEIGFIQKAIMSHRKEKADMDEFHFMLYRADKLSRKCYECNASVTCNWSSEKKNLQIRV